MYNKIKNIKEEIDFFIKKIFQIHIKEKKLGKKVMVIYLKLVYKRRILFHEVDLTNCKNLQVQTNIMHKILFYSNISINNNISS